MADKQASNQIFLRTIALVVVAIGAIGSLCFMFYAGRRNSSVILLGLFAAWVLSPFIGLIIANRISNSRTISARTILYRTMIVLSVASLIAYSGVLIPQGTRTAFIFLVAPFVSWVIIITVILVVRKSISARKL